MVAEHITNLPSNKHSGVRARTQMLVVHSAETPLLSGYALSVTANWLNKMYQANGELIEASINTFFGPDTTVRSVHTDCVAWHASWANAVSVGYEFTGYAALSREQWLTDGGKAMIDRAGREMAADAAQYGIPLRWLTTAEVHAIRAGNTAIKGLATHRQIDPGSRTDPGDGFPYDVLMAAINHYSGNTASEEEEMNQAQDAALGVVFNKVNQAPAAGQLASQGDVNIVLARMEAFKNEVLAALGKPTPPPTATLVKGDKTPTVYAWDGGTGYRALDYAEFSALMSTGATLETITQDKINAAVTQ